MSLSATIGMIVFLPMRSAMVRTTVTMGATKKAAFPRPVQPYPIALGVTVTAQMITQTAGVMTVIEK